MNANHTTNYDKHNNLCMDKNCLWKSLETEGFTSQPSPQSRKANKLYILLVKLWGIV